jgi:hypothetical protein
MTEGRRLTKRAPVLVTSAAAVTPLAGLIVSCVVIPVLSLYDSALVLGSCTEAVSHLPSSRSAVVAGVGEGSF